jgi:hypothetical protein
MTLEDKIKIRYRWYIQETLKRYKFQKSKSKSVAKFSSQWISVLCWISVYFASFEKTT